jgi:hypothetical protein
VWLDIGKKASLSVRATETKSMLARIEMFANSETLCCENFQRLQIFQLEQLKDLTNGSREANVSTTSQTSTCQEAH